MNSLRSTKLIWPLASILTLVALTPPHLASADQKLTANDGAAGDYFGWSLALSGNTALIGAYQDDDRGINSGSAYIFEQTGVWKQAAKLHEPDGASRHWFGETVALFDDTALIGARLDGDLGVHSGSTYIFQKTDGVWKHAAKLTAEDGAERDWFGRCATLSGTRALIGASKDDDNGVDSGSAYIFEKTDGVWKQVVKLTADDGRKGDWFGWAGALSGDTALIGAYGDNGPTTDSGSAYIFEKTDGVWKQVAKLTEDDGANGTWFGKSVALTGNTALIGSQWEDRGKGAVYIFEKTGGVWKRSAKLTADDAAWDDRFGHSVALSGDTALIGALAGDGGGIDHGSAYIFERTGDVWKQVGKLIAPDGSPADFFGRSVALSGYTALVGAPLDDDRGEDSGSAYFFELCAPCDANCDGSVDLTDVEPFIELLIGGGQPCDACAGDTNDDGSIDATDIEGFLECLLGG